VGDVVNLPRYSYLNTPDRLGSIDDLRFLVIHYAACVVEDLRSHYVDAQKTGFSRNRY
jgi:hypothetical protein